MSDDIVKDEDPKIDPANKDHGSTEEQAPNVVEAKGETSDQAAQHKADEPASEEIVDGKRFNKDTHEWEPVDGDKPADEPAEPEPEDDRTFEQKIEDRLKEIERHLGIGRAAE